MIAPVRLGGIAWLQGASANPRASSRGAVRQCTIAAASEADS
jgi:hypothetical protein